MHVGDDVRMLCDEDRARHIFCLRKTCRLDRNKLTEINCIRFILKVSLALILFFVINT